MSESFAALLDESLSTLEMQPGSIVTGVVLDVASDVVDFKKGDRVFTHHHVSCYDCHFCNHGNETMCKKYSETNLSPCGLSEEYVVPAWNVSHGGVLKISDLSFRKLPPKWLKRPRNMF